MNPPPDVNTQPLGEKQRRFLAAFTACYSVTKAARWAKISRESHYAWMRDVPGYPAAFAAAERKGARTLQDEAVRRAHEGVRKAVRYKGKVVGYETEFSDTLMITMLKKADPEGFRDRSENRHTGPDGGPVLDADAFVAALRKRRAADAKAG